MKQLIYLLFFTFSSLGAFAQPTFSPSSFTAEDEITITIDVTGTGMAGAADAYIWIFSNPDIGGGADGITNGSWTNSSDGAKMTPAGTNKFTFKFIGTTMFGQTPAQLKSFGFLLKKKDGSAQTPDYKPFFFDPLIFVPTMTRIFPSKVDKDDVITINFDNTYAETTNDQRMVPKTVTVTMYDDLNAAVGSPLTLNLKNADATIWNASFIPELSFLTAAGRKLGKFKYRINGTVLDVNGAASTVSTADFEVVFTRMK